MQFPVFYHEQKKGAMGGIETGVIKVEAEMAGGEEK